MTGIETIAGRAYYLVESHPGRVRPAGPANSYPDAVERLFFDVQTGLLYKDQVTIETPLGTRVEETSFEDYRDVGGLKLPYLIITHYMEDENLFKIAEIEANIDVPPAKFEPPDPKKSNDGGMWKAVLGPEPRMMQMQRALVGGVLAAIAVLPSAARRIEQRGDGIALHACQAPRLTGTARCGTVTVFEDRARKTGRTIDLNVVVVPAESATPAADPVFWLAGGPGAAATDVAGAANGGLLGGLRRDRDLVFVDQRGTGKSNGLRCDLGDNPADLPAFFGELLPLDKIRQCRADLEKRANLALYTTSIAMDDLDDVRDALGYQTIDIVAASYGTIAAQAYLRQHPAHVRSVFLVGVATPGVKQPLLFARAAQHALDRLFEDCTADDTCREAFPHLKSEFDSVLARFRTGSISVDMVDPSSRQRRPVTLSRDSYVEHLRLMLYTTLGARYVPFVVHRAYQNDFIAFETMAIRNNPGATLARGMYLTVTCSEGVPFITDTEMADEARGTFVGEDRVRVHRKACAEWPHQTVPRSFIEPVTSDRPVFMFSGDVDGSTPPWFADAAVKYLSHGRQVRARYYGHQLDSPCLWKALAEFVAKGSGDGIDMGCAAEIRRPSFATDVPNPVGS